jgi:hypothetical protein
MLAIAQQRVMSASQSEDSMHRRDSVASFQTLCQTLSIKAGCRTQHRIPRSPQHSVALSLS